MAKMWKKEEIRIRDPFIYTDKKNGCYYMYGTTGILPGTLRSLPNFSCYKTYDFENFEGPFTLFETDGTDFWADRDFWAAEMHVYNGKYYLFGSCKAENKCRGTQIFVSDAPNGQFKPLTKEPVTPRDWECLDGTLYVENGQPYMVFCHEWVQAIDGEIWAIRLNDNLTAPAGPPHLLFTASEAEWIVPGRPIMGKPSFVTDGPFMWRNEDGTLLMLWAAFSKDGYTQGLARSSDGEITGDFKQVRPLFMKDGGHGMIFRTKEGKLMMTLHSPNSHKDERPYFFEVVEEDGLLHRK